MLFNIGRKNVSMINSVTNEVPNFLNDTPSDMDKICWKRTYATYLNVNNISPVDCAKEPLNLIRMLPVSVAVIENGRTSNLK